MVMNGWADDQARLMHICVACTIRYAVNSSRSRGTPGSIINRGVRFITEHYLAEPIGMPTPRVIFSIPSYFLMQMSKC